MLYTCDTSRSDKHNIFYCSLKNGTWSEPVPIPFSFTGSIGEPVFSPLSDKIYDTQLMKNDKDEDIFRVSSQILKALKTE